MKYLSTAGLPRRVTPVTSLRRGPYGSKIPTEHQLRIAGRWHRVYAICWGTSATCFVIKGGEKLYIATGEL